MSIQNLSIVVKSTETNETMFFFILNQDIVTINSYDIKNGVMVITTELEFTFGEAVDLSNRLQQAYIEFRDY